MKVNDIINRLKDTRGFVNEDKEETEDLKTQGCSWDTSDRMNDLNYMLDGINGAIQFFEEWLLTNEDFTG